MDKKNEQDLYEFCLENTAERFMGTLEQCKIDKLNEMNFPWAHYAMELDKLGFYWEKNGNGKTLEDFLNEL